MAFPYIAATLAIVILGSHRFVGLIRPESIRQPFLRYAEPRPRPAKLNPFYPMHA